MTPFRTKPSLPVVAIPVSERVSLYDKGPLLKKLIFFAISHGSYKSDLFTFLSVRFYLNDKLKITFFANLLYFVFF